ncbi:LysR family transcriptional regulator [Aureibacillus halotolerans]|uniref:DNA-binding transcriptional LysR family regulator n=1 Tax=Aureibacillus halotolerans TaxID=1508390 RepID=A0A4R6UCZ9_9BACI|nr:LysR family transcriptional regulator [Aureibacillus halotolerans]TDQ42635.1 DNA-binding transcriptional LysR family regulator [Aureibacillus halotolerans]
MNIKWLELFCYIVEEGSISSAGRRAFISQPSVTKNIRSLEDVYGILLFQREKNSLTLTDAGELLYPHAKAMLAEYQNSVEAIGHLKDASFSRLNIGASFTLGEYVLPPVIQAYQDVHTHDRVQLAIYNTPTILQMLDMQTIDMAFVEGEVESKSFHAEAIAYDEVILIVDPKHPWANQHHVFARDLLGHAYVSREETSHTRRMVEEHLAKKIQTKELNRCLALSTTQAVKNAVQSGLGFGFVSAATVQHELKHGLLVQVDLADVKLTRPFWCVTKPMRFEKPSAAAFLQLTKKLIDSGSHR